VIQLRAISIAILPGHGAWSLWELLSRVSLVDIATVPVRTNPACGNKFVTVSVCGKYVP
jgi:hypothetical protein